MPQGAADGYAWLRGLPFVTGQAGRCRYHDVVRAPMLRLQRTQSPTRWQHLHTLLADTYQQRRRTLEAALPADKYWDDAAWREDRLNETYHRLCADPRQALPDTLQQALHACYQGAAVLRRWSQILTQAGIDTDTTPLTTWAVRLTPPAPETDDTTVLVNALTQLLSAPGLATADQALAHSLRGREHSSAKRYQQALTDYTTALTLDPHLDRAHYGRGVAHRFLRHYDDALADFNHALELNPDDAWSIAIRGATHRLAGHYDDALADLNHALELNPDNAWAIAIRGATHCGMGYYDDALADFNHALELNPDDAWSIAIRGATHRLAGHYDDALADFDHALELNPDDAWVHFQVAATLRLLARPREHEHWRKAVEILTAETSAGGSSTVHARGILLVVYCALPEWDNAAEELERFLACAPKPSHIREALQDLTDLPQTLPVAPTLLQPLRQRLENAAAGTIT